MMNKEKDLPVELWSRDSLALDVEHEVGRLAAGLRAAVHHQLRRRGAVVGISGGIDSSVVLALCAKALGPERVLGVLMPEKESSGESRTLPHLLARHFGVETVTEDITPALEGIGCYRRRNEAIARVFPDFGPGWKAKIVLPGSLLNEKTLNLFQLTVIDPAGEEYSQRLPLCEYYQVVAASNFKQRTRMSILYYHAELRNYAVVGTANKNEHGLGFFVKHGDGGVDVFPITHLFKAQVYQLARYLDVPKEIQEQQPATDTYSAGGTQEEFFFRLPFDILDRVWADYEQGVPCGVIAADTSLSIEQVERIVADVERKQRTNAALKTPPIHLGEAETSNQGVLATRQSNGHHGLNDGPN